MKTSSTYEITITFELLQFLILLLMVSGLSIIITVIVMKLANKRREIKSSLRKMEEDIASNM